MKRMRILLVVLAASACALAYTLAGYNASVHAGQAAAGIAPEQLKAVQEEGALPAQDMALKNAVIPDDPYYSKQWALPLLKSKAAAGGVEVVVAVLDSGIDITHEDLAGRVIGSVNFSRSDTACDRLGHGTHMAGIIAANANNGLGIAGIAPNVKLLNVKVAEDNGLVWPSNLARGIIWAVDNGARVINMSLTVPDDSSKVASAVKYALDHNVILVSAAGNSVNSQTYPSAYDGVIGVAALSEDGASWAGNASNQCVDVYAPGSRIYSTVPGNGYDYKSGSSMATAFVSALAALEVGRSGEDMPDAESLAGLLKVSLTLAAK